MRLSRLDIHPPFEKRTTGTVENENQLDAMGEEANPEKNDAEGWIFALSSTRTSDGVDYGLGLANPDAKQTQSIYIGEEERKLYLTSTPTRTIRSPCKFFTNPSFIANSVRV
jgi:hypothetical protein